MGLLDYTTGPVAMAAPALVKAMTASGSFANAVELEKIRQGQQRLDMESARMALDVDTAKITTALKQQQEWAQAQEKMRQERNDYTMQGGRRVDEGDQLEEGERVVYLQDGTAMAVPDTKAYERNRQMINDANNLLALGAQPADPKQGVPPGRVPFLTQDGRMFHVPDPKTERDWDNLQSMIGSQLNSANRVIDTAADEIPRFQMRALEWQEKMSEIATEITAAQERVKKYPGKSQYETQLAEAQAQMQVAESAIQAAQDGIKVQQQRRDESVRFIEQSRGIMHDRFSGRPIREDLYEMLYPQQGPGAAPTMQETQEVAAAEAEAAAAAPPAPGTDPAVPAGKPAKREMDFSTKMRWNTGLRTEPKIRADGAVPFYLGDDLIADVPPDRWPGEMVGVMNDALVKHKAMTAPQARAIVARQVFSPSEILDMKQQGLYERYIAALIVSAGGSPTQQAEADAILQNIAARVIKRSAVQPVQPVGPIQ